MDKVIREVSLRLNIPKSDVERVINSQYKMIKLAMESGKYESFRAIHLGIFGVKKNRKKLRDIELGRDK